MCLGCMHFRAPRATLKQKNYSNFFKFATNYKLFSGYFQVHAALTFGYLLKTIICVKSLL